MDIEIVCDAIRENLSEDLRSLKYRNHPNKYRGHCYVAAEALYHLLPKEMGFKPYVLRIEEDTHWYLMTQGHEFVIDPTWDQFDTAVKNRLYKLYSNGRCCGFLTKKPSKRASELIRRVKQTLKRKNT